MSAGARSRRAALSCLLALTLLVSPTMSGAQQLEVIELRYRTAEELIPVLEPLLEEGAALTGAEYRLFVRTSPGNLAELREVVATLDRRPRELLVAVRQGAAVSDDRSSASAGVRVDSGEVEGTIGTRPPAEPGVEVHAQTQVRSLDVSNMSQVRVLEGTEAFIAVGRSLPVPVITSRGHEPPQARIDGTFHRTVQTGFTVIPRLQGEWVSLEVAPVQERLIDERTGSIDTQRIATTIEGRLGEWIRIGGHSESVVGDQRGVLDLDHRESQADRSVWVRVTAFDD